MLLNIYLAATGACVAVDVICGVAILNKLNRDGYEFVKKEKSVAEHLVGFIKTFGYLAIPVINVITAVGFLYIADDQNYEKIKRRYIEEGIIVNKNSNIEERNNATIEDRLHSIQAERDALLREKKQLQDAINSLDESNSIKVSINGREYKYEDYSNRIGERHPKKGF